MRGILEYTIGFLSICVIACFWTIYQGTFGAEGTITFYLKDPLSNFIPILLIYLIFSFFYIAARNDFLIKNYGDGNILFFLRYFVSLFIIIAVSIRSIEYVFYDVYIILGSIRSNEYVFYNDYIIVLCLSLLLSILLIKIFPEKKKRYSEIIMIIVGALYGLAIILNLLEIF